MIERIRQLAKGSPNVLTQITSVLMTVNKAVALDVISLSTEIGNVSVSLPAAFYQTFAGFTSKRPSATFAGKKSGTTFTTYEQ